MGAFDEHSERLFEQGYQVIPIIPGTKRPGFFHAGRGWIGLKDWVARFNGRASLNAERKLWGCNDAGIGVLAGPASGNLIGVDIDTDVVEIVAALLTVLPPTPVKKAGAKGETRFYHGPGIASQSWTIAGARIVEIIGPGRQTVLPPTIHPDTQAPYRWLTPDTLEDVPPKDLPALPADIAEAISHVLEPFGYQAPPQHIDLNGDGDGRGDATPHRELNNAALGRLDLWVPDLKLYKVRRTPRGYEAVAVWRPSSTGRVDQTRSRNLKIAHTGIRDFGADTGYTPLDLVMAALGVDLDAAFAFLNDRLNWAAAPELKIAPAENEAEAATAECAAVHDAAAADSENTEDPLEPHTHIPGAVGEVINWIVSTARRPNRVLALGAAITLIGTLIGRRVAGPTYSATHLYIVSLAPATAGKDHPRRCILPLLEAAHAGVHGHLGDVTSQSGFNRAMKSTPLCVVVIDEIAGFLGRIVSPKSSFWERRLAGKLREQWSCSFGTIGTMTSAEYAAIHIKSPAMSIFGTSTSTEFWSVLQKSEVENGFFSRLLVLESNRQAPDQNPQGDPSEIPQSLADWLGALYCWGNKPLATARLNDPEFRPLPQRLQWCDRGAEDCYRELLQWVDREIENDARKQAYVGRIAETAVRLATIRAAGRCGPGARVDLQDMEWGSAVAGIAVTTMMDRAQDSMVQTVRSEFAEKLVDFIQRRGAITRQQLQQHIRSRFNTREVSDMLSQSIEAGLISKTKDGYAAK